jgi:DNA repair ATPase RecN
MASLYERIKALIENSEDLSDLPQIATDVQTLEAELEDRENRIAKLHEINRKYLKMIPVDEPPAQKEEKEEPPTIDDAVEAIKQIL